MLIKIEIFIFVQICFRNETSNCRNSKEGEKVFNNVFLRMYDIGTVHCGDTFFLDCFRR